MVDGVVYLRADAGCTCRVWGLADVEVAEERAAVQQRQAEAEEYCALVERWNAQVAGASLAGGVSAG
jgi:hypothetical protein